MPDLAKLHNLAGRLRAETPRPSRDRSSRKWYDIRNTGSDLAEVFIYEQIGEDWYGDGMSAKAFTADLRAITAGRINLHLNSEGGEVFDGIAIYESLCQHPAKVRTMVDGLAASAASYIAMAADPYDAEADTGGILVARNARIMIHDAGVGGAYGAGNARQMREFATEVVKLADLLDDLSNNIAGIYADRAGKGIEHWRELMLDETWFSAQQAIDAGLADGIIGETSRPATADVRVEDHLDLDVASLVESLKGAWA